MEDPRLIKRETPSPQQATAQNLTELSEKSQDFTQQNNKTVNRHKVR